MIPLTEIPMHSLEVPPRHRSKRGCSNWLGLALAVLFSSEPLSQRVQAFNVIRHQPKQSWKNAHGQDPQWQNKVRNARIKGHDSLSNNRLWASSSDGQEEEAEEQEEELGSHPNGSDESKHESTPAPIITQEMFLRDLLQDPQVLKKKKKKNGGSYQPMDNRDHLPFVVQVMQPDPYTKRQVIQEKARQRTKEENAKKKKKGKVPPVVTSSIASSLQLQQNDGSTQILGEFALDKSTTSGDWILIGDVEYQVTSAKCQYKYAGGKRFVMVRKILQVKEIRRLEQEAQLLRQLQATPDVDADAAVLVDLWEDDASASAA